MEEKKELYIEKHKLFIKSQDRVKKKMIHSIY